MRWLARTLWNQLVNHIAKRIGQNQHALHIILFRDKSSKSFFFQIIRDWTTPKMTQDYIRNIRPDNMLVRLKSMDHIPLGPRTLIGCIWLRAYLTSSFLYFVRLQYHEPRNHRMQRYKRVIRRRKSTSEVNHCNATSCFITWMVHTIIIFELSYCIFPFSITNSLMKKIFVFL